MPGSVPPEALEIGNRTRVRRSGLDSASTVFKPSSTSDVRVRPCSLTVTVRRLRIHSSTERSAHAFLSVPYRDHWFWIDDRDLTTKRNFALVMLLFSLADTGERKGLPLITILSR
jgi:hypothetical protein